MSLSQITTLTRFKGKNKQKIIIETIYMSSLALFYFSEMHYFYIFAVAFLALNSSITCDVIVDTPNGKIRGLITRTQKGRSIYTFYGIRYGEPPIGKNRFKPPIPVKPSSTIQSATTQGQACYQSTRSMVYSLNLTEDCLFLDVYSTNLHVSRPVIIFIHGGTFIFGSKFDASPTYLLDKDVVLVVINYRLDVFGFFSIRTKDASGNQGFKDQNLAIKWVHKNIRSFGGNPSLITLCGQSAGAFGISLHLVSPLSYGLFQRVIAMSGSGVSFNDPATRNSSEFVLQNTNCSQSDPAEAVKCLQAIPAETLINISSQIPTAIAWFYDIESLDDDQPFLTEKPRDIARSGRIQKVPILTGITLDEFLTAAYETLQDPGIVNIINNDFSNTISQTLLYSSYPNKDHISAELKSFYLKNQSISMKTLEPLGELLSDGLIEIGVNRLVKYAKNITKVYYYRFDYQGRYSQIYKKNGQPLGILHADDLQYIFLSRYVAPVFKVDSPENFMVERMTSWFAHFAKTGNPNDPFNAYTNNTKWPACGPDRIWTMYINKTLKVSGPPFQKRYALWDKLFPLY